MSPRTTVRMVVCGLLAMSVLVIGTASTASVQIEPSFAVDAVLPSADAFRDSSGEPSATGPPAVEPTAAPADDAAAEPTPEP